MSSTDTSERGLERLICTAPAGGGRRAAGAEGSTGVPACVPDRKRRMKSGATKIPAGIIAAWRGDERNARVRLGL